jgi:hypothetical protein
VAIWCQSHLAFFGCRVNGTINTLPWNLVHPKLYTELGIIHTLILRNKKFHMYSLKWNIILNFVNLCACVCPSSPPTCTQNDRSSSNFSHSCSLSLECHWGVRFGKGQGHRGQRSNSQKWPDLRQILHTGMARPSPNFACTCGLTPGVPSRSRIWQKSRSLRSKVKFTIWPDLHQILHTGVV